MHSSETIPVGSQLPISVKAYWLKCQEVCLPEDAQLATSVEVGLTSKESPEATLIRSLAASFPQQTFPHSIGFKQVGKELRLQVNDVNETFVWSEDAYFFENSGDLVDPNLPQRISDEGKALRIPLKAGTTVSANTHIKGLLLQDENYWKVDFSFIDTKNNANEASSPESVKSMGSFLRND